MSFLIRTKVGPFSLSDGLTLEEIKKRNLEGTLSTALLSTDNLFMDYPAVFLDESIIKNYLNGMSVIYRGKEPHPSVTTVRVYSEAGLFIGLGLVSKDIGGIMISPKKLLINH